jgi:hypothetical protein
MIIRSKINEVSLPQPPLNKISRDKRHLIRRGAKQREGVRTLERIAIAALLSKDSLAVTRAERQRSFLPESRSSAGLKSGPHIASVSLTTTEIYSTVSHTFHETRKLEVLQKLVVIENFAFCGIVKVELLKSNYNTVMLFGVLFEAKIERLIGV